MKEYRFSEQETKELIGGFAKLHRMAVTAGELAEIVKLHLVPSEKDAFPVGAGAATGLHRRGTARTDV